MFVCVKDNDEYEQQKAQTNSMLCRDRFSRIDEQPLKIVDHHVDRALVEDFVVILKEFQPDLREQTLLHVALKPLALHLMSSVDVRAGVVEQREEVMPQTNGNERRLEVEFQQSTQKVDRHEEQRFQIGVDRRRRSVGRRAGHWWNDVFQTGVLRVIRQGKDQIRREEMFQMVEIFVADAFRGKRTQKIVEH